VAPMQEAHIAGRIVTLGLVQLGPAPVARLLLLEISLPSNSRTRSFRP
jgi:hypothetical protein